MTHQPVTEDEMIEAEARPAPQLPAEMMAPGRAYAAPLASASLLGQGPSFVTSNTPGRWTEPAPGQPMTARDAVVEHIAVDFDLRDDDGPPPYPRADAPDTPGIRRARRIAAEALAKARALVPPGQRPIDRDDDDVDAGRFFVRDLDTHESGGGAPVPYRLVDASPHMFAAVSGPTSIDTIATPKPSGDWISTPEAAAILGMSLIGCRKVVGRGLTHKIDDSDDMGRFLIDRGHAERLAQTRVPGETRTNYTAEKIKRTASPDWKPKPRWQPAAKPISTADALNAIQAAAVRRLGAGLTLQLSPQASAALQALVDTGYFGDSPEACAEQFVLAGIRDHISFTGGDE